MKILIYGSTRISQEVARHLLHRKRDLVGYVPSVSPKFPGKMPIPEVDPDTPHDIILSVQYDKKIPVASNVYNLHTGLLPEYAGCNILSHTLLNGDKEQGLTFHQISDSFDAGEIIAKISYQVLPTDNVGDLYMKMLELAGPFANLCIDILHHRGNAYPPTVYKRKDLDPEISARDIKIIQERIT